MDEADRQLRSATAIGGTVRWVFSDQAAADAVWELFNGVTVSTVTWIGFISSLFQSRNGS